MNVAMVLRLFESDSTAPRAKTPWLGFFFTLLLVTQRVRWVVLLELENQDALRESCKELWKKLVGVQPIRSASKAPVRVRILATWLLVTHALFYPRLHVRNRIDSLTVDW